MAALLAALAGAGQADTPLRLSDLIAAKSGAVACWQRVYGPAHLAAHPHQTVTRMTLGLGYHDDGGAGSHSFGVWVTRRGEAGPAGEGGLCHDRPGGVGCYVDCDGGGFLLRRAGMPGAVLLDLTHTGRLRLMECGDEAYTPSRPPLVPGRDDKIFLLHPVEAGTCPQ